MPVKLGEHLTVEQSAKVQFVLGNLLKEPPIMMFHYPVRSVCMYIHTRLTARIVSGDCSVLFDLLNGS